MLGLDSVSFLAITRAQYSVMSQFPNHQETSMQSTPETRIQELHLTLPAEPAKPVAKYKTAVLAGNILYVSGHGPVKNTKGKVGKDLTLEQGKGAARDVGL